MKSKRSPILLLIGLIIIGIGAYFIYIWNTQRFEYADYWVIENPRVRMNGFSCGENDQKLKIQASKNIWKTTGVWIPRQSFVLAMSMSRQPFIMKIVDVEQPASLDGGTFMAHQSLMAGAVEQTPDYVPIVDTKQKDGSSILADHFVVSRNDEQVYVKNSPDASLEEQEIVLCIMPILYIKKSALTPQSNLPKE